MDKLNIDGEIYNKLPDQQIKIFIINNSKDEKNSSIKKTKPIKSEYFHDNIIYKVSNELDNRCQLYINRFVSS